MLVYLQSGTIKWKLIIVTRGNGSWLGGKWPHPWQQVISDSLRATRSTCFNHVSLSHPTSPPVPFDSSHLISNVFHGAANPLQSNGIMLQCGPNIIIRWMAPAHFSWRTGFLGVVHQLQVKYSGSINMQRSSSELTAHSHRTPSPFVLRQPS